MRRSAGTVLRRVAPRLAADLSWRRALARDASLSVVSRLIRPGAVAADVGASRGVFTAHLEQLVGPAGRVHAYEPNPESVTALRRLTLDRTTVHDVALSDAAGTATLHVPWRGGRLDDGLAFLHRPAAKHGWRTRPVDVRTARLDDQRLERLDFLKCDVEGHEHAVLVGARDTLVSLHPTLLVEIERRHRDVPLAATFGYLADLGYSGWALFPDAARPVAAFCADRDQVVGADGEPLGTYVHNFVFSSRAVPW